MAHDPKFFKQLFGINPPTPDYPVETYRQVVISPAVMKANKAPVELVLTFLVISNPATDPILPMEYIVTPHDYPQLRQVAPNPQQGILMCIDALEDFFKANPDIIPRG